MYSRRNNHRYHKIDHERNFFLSFYGNPKIEPCSPPQHKSKFDVAPVQTAIADLTAAEAKDFGIFKRPTDREPVINDEIIKRIETERSKSGVENRLDKCCLLKCKKLDTEWIASWLKDKAIEITSKSSSDWIKITTSSVESADKLISLNGLDVLQLGGIVECSRPVAFCQVEKWCINDQPDFDVESLQLNSKPTFIDGPNNEKIIIYKPTQIRKGFCLSQRGRKLTYRNFEEIIKSSNRLQPTRVAMLLNIAQLDTDKDILQAELTKDFRDFEGFERLNIDRGYVFVLFENSKQATHFLRQICGRVYCGRTVLGTYYDLRDWELQVY
ncbi:hypothetical protein DAMA08_014730 [Martiniozyma asiatica (nom. inval.)]|nr:hypothetical protein DAMA08_014730 [Martiniozyma asiatica]